MRITRPYFLLALLTGINLVNYLDRYIIAAVGPKVQEELGFSDFQFGLVVNAFMIGYFATSPFFGALGDRRPRKGLIAIGIAIFSLATAASGLMRSFASMLGARFAVGVGEASYGTLAPTIIDDLAPPARKSRWLAVFYVAIPVGSALGYLLGGAIESLWGWRTTFFVAGLPGLLLALAYLLTEEPARRERPTARPALAEYRRLASIPLYRSAVIGYTAYTFALGGFAAWAPKYLYQQLEMDLAKADFLFGAVLCVAGLLATAIGGWLGDRWPGADRARANLRICALSSIAAVPCAAACLLAETPLTFFAAIFAAELCLFLATAPINVALLHSVPEGLRASAMAASIFVIHLLGDFISPPLIGAISDASTLRTGMWVLPVAIGIGAATWWFGSSQRRELAQGPAFQ